jgi:hypothetical protein
LRGRALLLLALGILGRAITASSAVGFLTLIGTAALLTVSIGLVILLGVSFVVGIASVSELHWFAGNEEFFAGLVLKEGFWVKVMFRFGEDVGIKNELPNSVVFSEERKIRCL